MNKKYWLLGAISFESVWIVLWLISFALSEDRHDFISTFFTISILAIIIGSAVGWIYGKLSAKSVNTISDRIQYKKFAKRLLVTLAVIAVVFVILSFFVAILSGNLFGFS